MVVSAYRVVDDLVEAMRTGHGLGWGDQHPELFGGVERFFRPTYDAYLTSEWITLLDGVEERLRAGGRVADVGCGHGVTSLLLAAAYPGSEVHGFDPHVPSIEQARRQAVSQGRDSHASFQVASAHDFPGSLVGLQSLPASPTNQLQGACRWTGALRRRRRGRAGNAGNGRREGPLGSHHGWTQDC